MYPRGECECEHRAHFRDEDALTPNGNPGHLYGTYFARGFLHRVKTTGGTFINVCRDCFTDCTTTEIFIEEEAPVKKAKVVKPCVTSASQPHDVTYPGGPQRRCEGLAPCGHPQDAFVGRSDGVVCPACGYVSLYHRARAERAGGSREQAKCECRISHRMQALDIVLCPVHRAAPAMLDFISLVARSLGDRLPVLKDAAKVAGTVTGHYRADTAGEVLTDLLAEARAILKAIQP